MSLKNIQVDYQTSGLLTFNPIVMIMTLRALLKDFNRINPTDVIEHLNVVTNSPYSNNWELVVSRNGSKPELATIVYVGGRFVSLNFIQLNMDVIGTITALPIIEEHLVISELTLSIQRVALANKISIEFNLN